MKPTHLLGMLLLLLPSALVAAKPHVIGDAYSASDGQLLYTEEHSYSADRQYHHVIYRDPQGQRFAHKQLDYAQGAMSPAYVFFSEWTGEQWRVSPLPDRLRIFRAPIQAGDSDVGDLENLNHGDGDAEEANEIPRRQPLVIDAGFDPYIRHHWQRLSEGQSLSFYFPLPSSRRLVKLRVRQQACSDAEPVQRCFLLKPHNWLLALLAKPIELTYDRDSRRLMRFRGLSNIQGRQGQPLQVDIRYRYLSACCAEP